jgi:uncharacterized membrane protein
VTTISQLEPVTDVTDADLALAVKRLDPASRALLDLALHRGLRIDDIADVLGTNVAVVAAWFDDALFFVSSHVGVGDTQRVREIEARLAELPAEAWGAPHPPAEPYVAPRTPQPRPAAVPWPAEKPRAQVARNVAAGLGMLALVPLLVAARGIWAADAALLVLLFLAPGHLLLRALRVRAEAISASPVYVPCASVAVLIAAGLAVNMIGPLVGVAAPLRTVPMLVGVEVVCLALLVAGARAGAGVGIRWKPAALRIRAAWPLVLPLLAAAGAARLTNGASNSLAVVALAATAVVLVLALVRADRLSRGQLSVLLFSVALAAIWSFTLRGHFLYGWDITGEYHVLTSTIADGVWHTNQSGDAYGAMLSLTVLPALLHALTGLSALTILKVLYPVLFALFPVALFWLALRFLSRRWAFVTASFVLVQAYFFQQLPGIARQEIGLLFYVAFIAVLFDRRLARRSQLSLLVVFALGVVVSHYSTTYLSIAMLGLALPMQLGLRVLRRAVPHVTVPIVVGLVAMVAGAGVWYSAVTHSASNAQGFTSSIREHGLDLLPSAKPGQSLVQSYLLGNTATRVSAPEYARLVRRYYDKKRSFVSALPVASSPRYALQDANPGGTAARASPLYERVKMVEVVFGQLANLLAIVGAVILVMRRRTSPLARGLGLLALATLASLVFVRLSGTAANAYNQERAFVQTMVLLGIAMAWAAEGLSRRAGRLRPVVVGVAIAGLSILFVGSSGLRDLIAGHATPSNIGSAGEDYERFYISGQELAAAKWTAAAPKRGLLYTDRYGQLRILAATGRVQGLLLDPTPMTLDRHAWIYATHTNVVDGRARGELERHFASYRFPDRFLADQFDTIYTNGSSKVYRR